MQPTRVQIIFSGVRVQTLPLFTYQPFIHYTINGNHLLDVSEQLHTFVDMKPNTPIDVILYFVTIATVALLTVLIF